MSVSVAAEELCFCGRALGEETVILIESGQMLPSKKDNRFLRFHPDWTLPGSRWSSRGDVSSVLRKVVHFDCFVEQFNEADTVWLANPRQNCCHVCSLDFTKARWAHRYTLGTIEEDLFVPDPEMPKNRNGIVCGFCAEAIAQSPQTRRPTTEVGQLSLLF